MADSVGKEVLGLTARIVAAHISHNYVATDALPDMIQQVYQFLASAGNPESTPGETPVSAVAIKQSVFPEFIICLENGKKLKMLKRHLQVHFGMTPADYRAKWGLPPSYPMVAPNYASVRSQLAKSAGLDRKPQVEPELSELVETSEPTVTKVPARRARGSKG